MGKAGKIILTVFIISLIIISGLFLIGYFKPKGAGIFVDSVPSSEVYINGSLVGSTPYEAIINPGEVTVKLVPQNTDLVFYETKVNLVSSIRTVIKREFAVSDEESSGEIASFEKVGGKEASVSIVSIPDAAQIKIDGQIRGFAPYKINSIMPGEHQLNISAVNFIDRDLTINAHQGYKLTVVVKLAEGEISNNPSPTPQAESDLKITKVMISETPNNFLRVRSSASTDSSEVARVVSGNTYPLIEEDSKTGWFKIEYEKGKQGWVSNEYSEKVEE